MCLVSLRAAKPKDIALALCVPRQNDESLFQSFLAGAAPSRRLAWVDESFVVRGMTFMVEDVSAVAFDADASLLPSLQRSSLLSSLQLSGTVRHGAECTNTKVQIRRHPPKSVNTKRTPELVLHDLRGDIRGTEARHRPGRERDTHSVKAFGAPYIVGRGAGVDDHARSNGSRRRHP